MKKYETRKASWNAFGQDELLASDGADIVVSVPARAVNCAKKGALRLDSVRAFAVDEADDMMEKGFKVGSMSWILSIIHKSTVPKLMNTAVTPKAKPSVKMQRFRTRLIAIFLGN